MTAAQRKQLEAALKELIKEIEQRGRHDVAVHRDLDTERADEEDDQPLEEMLATINSNRNANDTAVLAKAGAALARLHKDPADFGACQDCGDEIPFARLKAMPYAELCVSCQSAKDPKFKSRKKLSDFL